jgi:hypothetical protein
MVFVRLPEVIMMFLLTGSPTGNDLLALADPAGYFASRQIEVSIDRMAALAGEEPKDAKAQVRQLLALRYLAEHPEKMKKAEGYARHRRLIEEVAVGERAQDRLGFAKEYAERVLAVLDRKAPAVPEAGKLRDEALAWFPAGASFVGAIDARMTRGGPAPGFDASALLKKLPAEEQGRFYELIEKTGNARIDRIAFAYVHDDDPKKAKIFVRLTGKANSAWLISALRNLGPDMEESEVKDSRDEKIKVLQRPNQPPALLFFGDTDMMMIGFQRDRKNQLDLVDEVLAVRERKNPKPNAASGALKEHLKKVPDKAVAFVVGVLPEDLAREFKQTLGAAPRKITAYAEKIPTGFDISAVGQMASGEDAQTAVMQLSKLRKEGIDQLQKFLQMPEAAPRGMPVNGLINVLSTLQMQSEDMEVRLRVVVPRDVLMSVPSWILGQ